MTRYQPKEGYIQLWRRLRSHRFWPTYKRRKFTELEAWIDLLFDATYKTHRCEFRGRVFDLKPGEVVFSQQERADYWRWSRGTVRRFLESLERNGETIHHEERGVTRLSICKLAGYAEWRPDADTRSGTSGRRLGKKEKKEKKGEEGKQEEENHNTPFLNKVQVLVQGLADSLDAGKKGDS